MDLVSFIRKTRMHGFALRFLTTQRDRVFSGILGYSKYLRDSQTLKQDEEDMAIDFAEVHDWWNRDENLCSQEKFLVALLKRYRKNLNNETTKNIESKDNTEAIRGEEVA